MKKEELLSALRNQIREVSADEQGALRGGFMHSSVTSSQDDGPNNGVCKNNTFCNDNSYCNGNGECKKNGVCENMVKCVPSKTAGLPDDIAYLSNLSDIL